VTRFKVGLLGAGYIVQAHARALAALENVQMTAVCDVSQERAREVAASFGIARVFTSVEELIASDCDVVHVLLPPYLHEQVTRRLLEAGKSVLVEKPMGLSAGDCKALAFISVIENAQRCSGMFFVRIRHEEVLLRQSVNATRSRRAGNYRYS